MDALAKKTPKLKAYVVFQKGPDQRAAIEKLAADKGIKIPLTIPQDPVDEVLKKFRINPDARNTLLLYKGKQVLQNAVNVTEKSFGALAGKARKAAGK
jgi:hypothetical protein